MDLRYLKAFIATAKQGSFSKAAETLQIAQSAVSRQIKLLEKSTGQDLLVRSPKQIILTDKGRRLLDLAEIFLKQSEQVLQGEQPSLLRIGTVHGILETWLKTVIISYCRQYKHNLDVRVCSIKELDDMLLSGQLDVVLSPLPIRSDLIRCVEVFDEERWLVSRSLVDTSCLENYRWIVYNDEDMLFRLCSKKPACLIRVNSITTMLDLVAADCGIAVLPTHLLGEPSRLKLHSFPLPRHQSTPVFMASLNFDNTPQALADLLVMIESSPPPSHR